MYMFPCMDRTGQSLGGFAPCACCVGTGAGDAVSRPGECSACGGLGWFPCLDCLDSPGVIKKNCSDCDHEHRCVCSTCLGQGFPAGRVPCRRCLSRGRKVNDVSGVLRVDGTCVVCRGPCQGH